MQRKLLSIFALIVCIISCSKDKYQSGPSITLKSVSSTNIPVNGSMTIDLGYTDKQGNISNDTLFLIKVRNNIRQTTTVRDTLPMLIPDNPGSPKGEINLQLDYEDYLISAENPLDALPPATGKESDSLTFKFILKDNDNRTSDTLVIKNIVIQRE